MADNRHLRALRPDLKLISRRRAEGIRRREHDAVASVLEAHRQLADGGRLAHAVHADDHHDHRPLERLARHIHHLFENLLEDVARLTGVGDLPSLHAALELLDDLVAGAHAHVAHDQDVHKVLVEIVVDLLGRLNQLVHAARDVGAGLGKAVPQAGKQALLLLLRRRVLLSRRRLLGGRRHGGMLLRRCVLLLLLLLLLFAETKESHDITPFASNIPSLHRILGHVLELDAEHGRHALFLHRHAVQAVAALHRALSVGHNDKLRIR